MKTIVGAVLGALLLAAGYFLLSVDRDEPRVSSEFTGEVIEVDLSGLSFDGPALIVARDDSGTTRTIAVPSMGLALCEAFDDITPPDIIEPGDSVSAAGNLDEAGRLVPCADASHHLRVTSTVRDDALGYGFRYPKGPAGYVVVEDGQSEDADFVSGVTLYDRQEYEAFLASTAARDGPPHIALRVYGNPRNLSAFVWPMRNPSESNIGLALEEPEEAVVGGANASHYVADGLYPIDTYAIANAGYIYLLTCAYLSRDTDLYTDFQSVLASFTFIRTADQE